MTGAKNNHRHHMQMEDGDQQVCSRTLPIAKMKDIKPVPEPPKTD